MSSIEHSRAAYRADFVLCGAAVLGLWAWLAWHAPAGMGLPITACAAAGILAWSPIEYALGPVHTIFPSANGLKTAPIEARDDGQTGRLA